MKAKQNHLMSMLLAVLLLSVLNANAAIPPKPNKNQIAKDLVGYKLSEGFDDGWFAKDWYWPIKNGQIKAVEIKQVVRDTNNEYCIIALMRLQGEVSAFNAKVKVNYILNRQNKWQIEFVNSMGMSIVKTHKYDDCMQYSIVDDGWGGVNCLEIKNNCSVELAVAGWFYALGEWHKFAVRVEGNETTSVGGTFSGGSVEKYKVEFVERLD